MTFPDNFDQIGQYVNNDMKHRLKKMRLRNMQNFLDSILKKEYLSYQQNNKPDIPYSKFIEQFRKQFEKNQKCNEKSKNLKEDNSMFIFLLLQLEKMKPC